jgi:DNA-3-methyladenine glycosylase II
MDAPAAARAGIAALTAAQPAFARIEPAAGPLAWRRRPAGFTGLLQAIVAQQISNAAAAAIWARMAVLPGALTAAGLLALPEEALRSAGLSRPKVAHARALAEAFATGRLQADALARADDAAAIAILCAVRGLGPWTAEVYLLFAHDRLDVFPAADVALQASAADLLGLPARPAAAALRALAQPWAPHRGLAARLLWHWWRHRTGRPAMDDADRS